MNAPCPEELYRPSLSRGSTGFPAPPVKSTQTEIFCDSESAAGFTFALSQALSACEVSQPNWMMVQDKRSRRLTGTPFYHGLSPRLNAGLVLVACETVSDSLFAMEEGLRCGDLDFVIGEIYGDPREIDFTASRRLSVASEKFNVPLYLVRLDATANLSAARRRWRIENAASREGDQFDIMPRWRAELFRSRDVNPGIWSGGLAEMVKGDVAA